MEVNLILAVDVWITYGMIFTSTRRWKPGKIIRIYIILQNYGFLKFYLWYLWAHFSPRFARIEIVSVVAEANKRLKFKIRKALFENFDFTWFSVLDGLLKCTRPLTTFNIKKMIPADLGSGQTILSLKYSL